jgi:exopolysaccharide production protein ExoY
MCGKRANSFEARFVDRPPSQGAFSMFQGSARVEKAIARNQSELTLIVDNRSSDSAEARFVLYPDLVRAANARTTSFMYQWVKRCVDVAVCILFSPIVLPVFLVVALCVRLSSPGPIFYREFRRGRHGSEFTILKFRSMYTKEHLRDVLLYVECEKTQMNRRLELKHAGDPRVTPLGRYLRKLSLDELPQLINVLRGDMSLVGPRPVVWAELKNYSVNAHFYTLAVPGITGLWQVSGRNDVSYEQRVQFDVQYCSEWSGWLDTKILLRTFPAVLRGKGAY